MPGCENEPLGSLHFGMWETGLESETRAIPKREVLFTSKNKPNNKDKINQWFQKYKLTFANNKRKAFSNLLADGRCKQWHHVNPPLAYPLKQTMRHPLNRPPNESQLDQSRPIRPYHVSGGTISTIPVKLSFHWK